MSIDRDIMEKKEETCLVLDFKNTDITRLFH